MRTINKNVYKFSELSENAKKYAIQQAQIDMGYSWADDMLASINALAKHFGGKMTYWELDWFGGSYSHARFEMPEMDEREIRQRLGKLGSFDPKTLKGHGDCELTGYCGDEDAIDGFRIAFVRGKERNLEKLMQAAFDSWLKSAQADCEDQYTEEQYSEHSDANNYEYYENGDML